MTDLRPSHLRARDRTLPLGKRTYIMAILNLTSDSFSADGVAEDLDAAVRRAVTAQEQGADIIDIGAESARADVPVSEAVAEAELVARAVGKIAAETDLTISVDTYKGVVAEAALAAGARIINDIGGFRNGTETANVAAKYGAALVLNFTVERPKVRPASPPQYGDLIKDHLDFLRSRVEIAQANGVSRECLIIDPGIAFGKSHDEDLHVLRNFERFREIGLPIMVAASRKHFIASVVDVPVDDRDNATVAVTALSIAGGADIVRVHDVRGNVHAARIADAIVRGGQGDFAPSDSTWPWAASARPMPGTTITSI